MNKRQNTSNQLGDGKDKRHKRKKTGDTKIPDGDDITNGTPECVIEGIKCPKQHKPSNPKCRRIKAGMKALGKVCEAKGLDPSCIWGKDSPLMQAIDEGKIKQRTFNPEFRHKFEGYADNLALAANASNAVDDIPDYKSGALPVSRSSSSEGDLGNGAPRDNHSVPDNDSLGSQSINPDRPISLVSVESDADFLGPTVDPVSATTSRLKNNKMLLSIDISRCVKLFKNSLGWHVFDPGYPVGNTNLNRLSNPTNNLVFFLYGSYHWSLVHLNREQSHLKHYNSLKSTEMPISDLADWITKQPAFNVASKITIQQMDCPQQDDNFNCGIFVLAFLGSLLDGNDIPSKLDAEAFRDTFASRLIDPMPSEPARPLNTDMSPASSPPLDQRTFPTPPTLDTDTGVQQALRCLRRDRSDLEEKMKKLVVKQEVLSCMRHDLASLQQELEKDEKEARELQKKVDNPATTDSLYKEMQGVLEGFPKGNDFQNQTWLDQLKSYIEKKNDSMMAEAISLRKRLSSAQEKCEDRRKKVQQLQAEIDSHKQGHDAFQERIAKDEKILADTIGQLRADIEEIGDIQR